MLRFVSPKILCFVVSISIATIIPSSAHGQTGFVNSQSPLGTNLFTLEDYSPVWVFTDLFKTAREWLPQSNGVWDSGETLNTDANGWVKSLGSGKWAGTLMARGINGRYPAGKYLVLYDGEGTFEIKFDATVIESSPGRMVLDVNPSNDGILLRILTTNPSNYIRNIRVIMPGYWNRYETQTFHPLFLQALSPFKVIRFMDWQKTNFSKVTSWTARTTPNTYTQTTPQGAALEYMIELCNFLGADPWFCMPDQADDAYITNFATLVRDTLDPSLRVYIEFSNEIWNSGFSQGLRVQADGVAKWPSLNNDTGKFEARMRMYSERAVNAFDIWETVFGGTTRLVRVIASQHANNWTATKALEWNNANLKTDALATAPYWGNELGNPNKGFNTPGMTVDQILDFCEADIQTERERTQVNRTVANTFGVDLITYEGGQHLAGIGTWQDNATITSKFLAANRHPRMQQLYKTYLDDWKTDGGGLFMAFTLMGSYTKFGSWGLLEWTDQSYLLAPKYLGVVEGAYGDLAPLAIPATDRAGLAILVGVLSIAGIFVITKLR